jgi:hypothetical protein
MLRFGLITFVHAKRALYFDDFPATGGLIQMVPLCIPSPPHASTSHSCSIRLKGTITRCLNNV